MTTPVRRRAHAEDNGVSLAARQDAFDLSQLLAESLASGAERHALVVRLSLLPQGRAQPHHLRLARAALEPLLAAPRARLFVPSGVDLVMVWRGEADAALQECRRGLTYLFADHLPPDSAALAEHLSLPADSAALEALVANSLHPPGPAVMAVPAAPPLDLSSLALLEERLAQADVARFVRRRAICVGHAGGQFKRDWEERFLSVAELSQALLPDRDARGDPWLFRRLTRTLDRRMLALLAAPGELRGAGPFSLSLNVATILAPEFLRFDAALPAVLRGAVVIDLRAADLLADPAAFVFARDFAHARGYSLLLRGVTAGLVPVLPLDLTGLDWLQLRWSPELEAIDDLATPPQRIVLGHADTPEALGWGARRGIGRFVGRLAIPGQPFTPLVAADRLASFRWALHGEPSRNIALGGVTARA